MSCVKPGLKPGGPAWVTAGIMGLLEANKAKKLVTMTGTVIRDGEQGTLDHLYVSRVSSCPDLWCPRISVRVPRVNRDGTKQGSIDL